MDRFHRILSHRMFGFSSLYGFVAVPRLSGEDKVNQAGLGATHGNSAKQLDPKEGAEE